MTNFQEFLSTLVNQAGTGQGFDGNGTYLRVNTGGGSVLSSMAYPPGGFRNDSIFGNTQANVTGTRPTFTSTVPPYRTDVACSHQPAARRQRHRRHRPARRRRSRGPRDGAMRRAIREHLTRLHRDRGRCWWRGWR